MVECKPSETSTLLKYVRSGAVPTGQDLRLYDQGLFQFISQYNPTQDLGELWVTYCVEFYKPVLQLENSVIRATGAVVERSGVTNGNPLGTSTTKVTGSFPLTVGATSLSWSGIVGAHYRVDIYLVGAVNAIGSVFNAPTAVGAVGTQLFLNDSLAFLTSTGTNFTIQAISIIYTVTDTTTTLTFPVGGEQVPAAPCSAVIWVTTVDPAIV